MRNLSWQTDFARFIPYKKGDTLEFISSLSSSDPEEVRIDISNLKNHIDIDSIELNGEKVSEDILTSVRTQDSSFLKVTGKSKNPQDDNFSIENLIKITPLKIEKKIEKKENIVLMSGSLSVPSSISIPLTFFNSNINNLIRITGNNLENVDIVNIGWITFHPVLSSGSLFVQVERDTFATGEYFLFFGLKNGQIVAGNDKIHFEHSSEKINIANITPKNIPNNEDRFLVIQWNGFDKIISVQLSNNVILKNAEFHIINNQVAGVKIPKWLAPGDYYFNIMDTGTIYELKTMHFTITQ